MAKEAMDGSRNDVRIYAPPAPEPPTPYINLKPKLPLSSARREPPPSSALAQRLEVDSLGCLGE